MYFESKGDPGAINETTGASGLIQVMPGTIKWYNEQTKSNVPLSVMRGKTPGDAAIQIRVGLWVLGRFWRSAYRWIQKKNESADVPLDELVRFGDSFYAAGPGRVQGMAKKIIPITWASWAARYPGSNITRHGQGVWEKTKEQNPTWNLTAIDTWVRRPADNEGTTVIQTERGGMLIGLLILLVGWYLIGQKKGPKK